MLVFQTVSGAVLLDDRISCQEPGPGQSLPIMGEGYIVMTGDSANVSMTINGQRVDMGGDSILYVKPGAEHQHRGGSTLEKMKLAVGKIWALLERGKTFDEAVNAAVGVRG